MEKTWTIKLEIENEKGETIKDYKHVGMELVPLYINKLMNVYNIIIRMAHDMIDKVEDEGWL